MDAKDYWAKRALEREAESAAKGAALTYRLFREYEIAARKIRKDVRDFYSRYARENALSFDEAVKELNRAERQEWKGTLGEYVNRINAEKDPKIKALLKADLDALSYSSQQTRLLALEGQINLILNDLFTRGVNQMKETFGEAFTEAVYKKAYDIQSRIGFMSEMAKIKPAMVEDVLSYPWSGAHFSDRLWRNKQQLIFQVRETITQGMIRGDSAVQMSKALSNSMGKSYKTAERLIQTEVSYFHNEATFTAYEAAGLEMYEYMATLDERTCEKCGPLDGEHFTIEEKEIGENCGPMHARCRCTTIEYDPDDAIDWINSGQEMPPHMTYEQWAETNLMDEDA